MARKLSQRTLTTLKNKAKKSGISLSVLKKVHKRGAGAWLSSGSKRGMSMAQWSMARVNSFIRGSRKHDTDLRRKKRGKKSRKR
ncbi:MAG: hypothetical protein GOVbin4580_19 [Prokaryotic dsDNA virus sp.]|nr:MAG: hypothetical protein GOVbin4580_19 [Prokaryotic dsDNA virus sp.]|tara:strand:+ start:10884 stop:11135 length:252 start_codon:yes stop_codon:yes gene_type:complete